MSDRKWPMLDTLTIREPGPAPRILGIRRLVSRKWERWFVANWSSKPSVLVAYGQAMIAALLITTSIFGISASSRMDFAAARTLERESSWMEKNFVLMLGLMAWMVSIVGWILGRERPRRRIVEGEPRASEMAVSAPIPPWLGPVMRNVRPFT